MKRLFVFVPAILLVLFLISSFVLKEKEAGEKTTEESKLCKGTSLCDKPSIDSVRVAIVDRNKPAQANIVFKSTDGGKTWSDISEGLSEIREEIVTQSNGFFANARGLYLRVGNGIYYSESNSTVPLWKKEMLPNKQGSIAPGKNGLFAFDNEGQFFHKKNGTTVWTHVFTNFQHKGVYTVFETDGGIVFIGSKNGLFKSTNSGKTWKHVPSAGLVLNLVESNGVLLATGQGGILRSTDNGENWNTVISDGGVGIAIERIKGGFAAITSSTESMTRRVRTSYDGGKTWQTIDAGLKGDLSTTSIIQVGEDLFCGHPDGVFRSSDRGKTWKLLLASVESKVFNLFVSGNVIYAIPREGGC